MRFVVSWSGGKDSCLALDRAKNQGLEPACMITMLDETGSRSRSHGLPRRVLQAQSTSLGLPLIERAVSWQGYEAAFVSALSEARQIHGLKAAVFGDIDLEEHRAWEEKVCAQAGLVPRLPLWQQDRRQLLRELLNRGYQGMVVCLDTRRLHAGLLGRRLDEALFDELEQVGADAYGENGEYHSVVTDGPVFSHPIVVPHRGTIEDGHYAFLDW